jgi:hypothetical protein
MEMRSDIFSEKGTHKSGAVAAWSLEFCFISLRPFAFVAVYERTLVPRRFRTVL